jgi:Ca2+-binding EF-hand superfamily protein
MISRAEWTGFQEKVFAMLDRKRTGLVDAKELMHGSKQEVMSFAIGGYARGLMTDAMFKWIDADGDGTISHDEFLNYPLHIFDVMDTSTTHKGMLSPAELFAAAGEDPR